VSTGSLIVLLRSCLHSPALVQRALKEQNTLEEKDNGANSSSHDHPWNVNKTMDNVGAILKNQVINARLEPGLIEGGT
jgi:hypothetical protein